MTESIDQGLSSKPGRNPEAADQDFDTTRSLEEAFDDRGSVEKILDGVHDRATGRSGRLTAFTAGALYLFEEAVTQAPDSFFEELPEVVDEGGRIANQYPEGSTGLLAVAGALTAYNAAEEAGIINYAGNSVDYVKETLSDVDSEYVELTDEMVDQNLEPLGTPVDSSAGEDLEFYNSKEEYDPSA